MRTYELKKQPGVPLYECLYRCIREDILSGTLGPGEKLPSKRALAAHLEVSKITVEGAYAQLLAEGYICSREKVGYFVEAVAPRQTPPELPHTPEPEPDCPVDLTANGCPDFPFFVWSRLQREVMLDLGQRLLQPLPNQGLAELREAIARHLSDFRGMQVQPENIILGAGTDFLYNLLIQLLGRDKIYAVEDPGYDKIRRIYAAAGAACVSVLLDGEGVDPGQLRQAQVLHVCASHHFPTGLVTSMGRRKQLLQWAARTGERYIIEDDYDSEFRFDAHPMPALYSLDNGARVIYMNTFSKTLAPSIRISYMVLPGELMARFRRELGFYSCTVPSFEQYTLERFLRGGYFEKHINRMRKAYRQRRNQIIDVLRQSAYAGRMTILEQDAGLHFLVKLDTNLPEEELVRRLEAAGIRVRTLGSYYHGPVPGEDRACLVVNYSGLDQGKLQLLRQLLSDKI